MEKLDLQLFAEGMEGAAGQGGGDVTGAGGQSGTATREANGEPAQGQESRASFDDLIRGEYRQDYERNVGERIQAAVQQRFRNQQDYRARAEAAQPILQALSQRFGLAADDVAGITAKLNEDAYAEEANSRGLPVEVVREAHQLREENQRLQAANQESQRAQQFQAHFEGLRQQAAELQGEFPDFDLMREVETNETFRLLTSPQVGLSVRQAYWAVHGQDLARQLTQYAAQQAGGRIAASVAAGASRPMENGMQRPGAAAMGVSVANMTREQRESIRRQLSMGRPVTL